MNVIAIWNLKQFLPDSITWFWLNSQPAIQPPRCSQAWIVRINEKTKKKKNKRWTNSRLTIPTKQHLKWNTTHSAKSTIRVNGTGQLDWKNPRIKVQEICLNNKNSWYSSGSEGMVQYDLLTKFVSILILNFRPCARFLVCGNVSVGLHADYYVRFLSSWCCFFQELHSKSASLSWHALDEAPPRCRQCFLLPMGGVSWIIGILVLCGGSYWRWSIRVNTSYSYR